jgi:hypothetical protein
MHRLRRDAEAKTRRLLRVLFLWLGSLPAGPGRAFGRDGRRLLRRRIVIMISNIEAHGIGCEKLSATNKRGSAARLSPALQISRRGVLPAVWGVCFAGWGLRSVMAQEATKIRIQLDQQALNTLPGDERADLEVTEDTSAEAQALKTHSPPGKAIPIIYLVVGLLSLPDLGVDPGDAQAPRIWRGDHRHSRDPREHSSRPLCTSRFSAGDPGGRLDRNCPLDAGDPRFS